MAIAVEMKREWRRFKDDQPGERFENHRRRMEHAPRWQHVLRGLAGLALVVVGIVFCFLPGPGLLGVVFGLALLAGMSRWLSRMLDRAEPRIRDGLHRTNEWWHELPTRGQALLVGTAALVAAFGIDLVVKRWVEPMLS